MIKRLGEVILVTLLTLMSLSSCATLPENFTRTESYAITHTAQTTLGRMMADDLAANPGLSGFLPLGNGLDAFVARAVLASIAERSIDVQYYLYHDDLVGYLFTEQLIKAADRGVRVRILVDDMGLGGRDLGTAVLDSHPNVEVRIFNPFSRNTARASQFLTRMGSVTRRMHNKSFLVDNQATILGGRNIGNEYFEADPDLAFADLDVLAVGPVVSDVSTVFDLYWNSELACPIASLKGTPPTPEDIEQHRKQFNDFIDQQADSAYLRALRNSDLAQKMRADQVRFAWGTAEVVYDRPEKLLHNTSKIEYHLGPQLKPYLEQVKNELIIFSPYFVPGAPGTTFLTQLVERGVRVRIVTNSLASNDVGIVHSGYAKYRKALLRGGVELYEMNKQLTKEQRKAKKGTGGSSKASLHAKSFVFDREQIFIGSLNLDPRAVIHNTEIGVVIDSKEIADGMGQWFDQNIEAFTFRLELVTQKDGSEQVRWHGWENGQPVVYTKEPHTSIWQRFGVGFFSFWPIESQL